MWVLADLTIGLTVDWLHGDNYRVATIEQIVDDKVKLSGMTGCYFMNVNTLLRKLNAPDCQRISGFF